MPRYGYLALRLMLVVAGGSVGFPRGETLCKDSIGVFQRRGLIADGSNRFDQDLGALRQRKATG